MLNLLVQRFSWFRYGLVLGVLGLTSLLSVAQNTPTARYNTVAEMLATRIPSSANTRISALVTGRLTANDGGGGTFFYDPSSSVSTNLGTVFKPNDSGGRWIREYSGPANSKWFGAMGNGSDNTVSLQNALDTVKELQLDQGTYLTSQPLVVSGFTTVTGEGTIKSSVSLTSTTALLNIGGNGVSINGISIDGNNQVIRCVRVANGSKNVSLLNTYILNAFQPTNTPIIAAGIRIEGNTGVTIQNTVISNIVATANGTIGDDQGVARGIHISQAGSEGPPAYVNVFGGVIRDIAPSEDADGISYQGWDQLSDGSVKVLGVTFINVQKRAGKFMSPGYIASGNIITNSGTMYSAFSAYGSRGVIANNVATSGQFSKIIDVGTDSWETRDVVISGNILSSGVSATATDTEGIWVGSSYGVTNLTVSGNTINKVRFGVRLAGGVSGATIAGNTATAISEAAYYIGDKYAADGSYATNEFVVVSNNTFDSSSYGVRFKKALNSTVGFNIGTAVTPFFSDQGDGAFGRTYLYYANLTKGVHSNIERSTVGSMSPVTFTYGTPALQVTTNSTFASSGVFVDDGVNRRRAQFYVDDTNSKWGLDATYSSGGNIPFYLSIASNTIFRVDNLSRVWLYNDLRFNSGNTYDIGTSSGSRPRDSYASTSFTGPRLHLESFSNGSPLDGDVWYDSSGLDFKFRQNGSTVSLSKALSVNIGAACSDETTPITSGNGKVTFRAPSAFTLTGVRASLTTAQSSGSIFTVNIKQNGASVLSTKITIDNGATTSTTATTPPVISTSAITDDAQITVDVDQVGDGTATGLKIWLIGTR